MAVKAVDFVKNCFTKFQAQLWTFHQRAEQRQAYDRMGFSDVVRGVNKILTRMFVLWLMFFLREGYSNIFK